MACDFSGLLVEKRTTFCTNRSSAFFFGRKKEAKNSLGCRNLAKFSASLPDAFKLDSLKQKMRLFRSETENSSRKISKAEKRR
ncbi:MAG: hypothetical protein H6695_18115 [Deferribacteres bacterium]|nr:hypothetical protein [Deferribacteres bacterium]